MLCNIAETVVLIVRLKYTLVQILLAEFWMWLEALVAKQLNAAGQFGREPV